MNMKVYNGTSHELNFYRREDVEPSGRHLMVKEGALPYFTIPMHGELNAVFSTEEQMITKDPVPLYKGIIPKSADPVPAEYQLVVASRRYVDAAKTLGLETSKLTTVKDVVINSQGAPCGCLGLLAG